MKRTNLSAKTKAKQDEEFDRQINACLNYKAKVDVSRLKEVARTIRLIKTGETSYILLSKKQSNELICDLRGLINDCFREFKSKVRAHIKGLI